MNCNLGCQQRGCLEISRGWSFWYFCIEWLVTYQCYYGVDGAVESVAEGSHAVVGVRVVIAEDVVLQGSFHFGQIVAHPPATTILVLRMILCCIKE